MDACCRSMSTLCAGSRISPDSARSGTVRRYFRNATISWRPAIRIVRVESPGCMIVILLREREHDVESLAGGDGDALSGALPALGDLDLMDPGGDRVVDQRRLALEPPAVDPD